MARRSRRGRGSKDSSSSGADGAAEAVESVRLDKWLWAARCFKTRSQATDACSEDKARVNDRVAKASQAVKVGDTVDVVCPGGRRVLEVRGLAERRGPAAAAQALYEDHTPPPEPDVHAGDQQVAGWDPGKRPDKRSRRKLRELRDRW